MFRLVSCVVYFTIKWIKTQQKSINILHKITKVRILQNILKNRDKKIPPLLKLRWRYLFIITVMDQIS